MTKHLFALTLVFLAACGGSAKPAGSASSGSDDCPNTPANIRDACGCRPTEAHYITNAGKLGAPSAKTAAIACATGTNGGDAMVTCMKDKGVSSATMALMGKPAAGKDAAFDGCVAKLAP